MPATIDPRAPRFNQGVVGVLALLAFLLQVPWILAIPALALAAGAFLGPRANPLALLWRTTIVPSFKLGPPKAAKDASPVRFAQGVGLVFLVGALASLYALTGPAALWIGWGLALVVAALALLAAVTDVCVGCEIYVLLARLKTPRRVES